MCVHAVRPNECQDRTRSMSNNVLVHSWDNDSYRMWSMWSDTLQCRPRFEMKHEADKQPSSKASSDRHSRAEAMKVNLCPDTTCS